ncbi:hypothetical protein BDR26DRAFT_955219 [Obelidium mucronatum]|nr:hypothetical protein BDR26DRAFT_955219 [Obelidium mucronatum]
MTNSQKRRRRQPIDSDKLELYSDAVLPLIKNTRQKADYKEIRDLLKTHFGLNSNRQDEYSKPIAMRRNTGEFGLSQNSTHQNKPANGQSTSARLTWCYGKRGPILYRNWFFRGTRTMGMAFENEAYGEVFGSAAGPLFESILKDGRALFGSLVSGPQNLETKLENIVGDLPQESNSPVPLLQISTSDTTESTPNKLTTTIQQLSEAAELEVDQAFGKGPLVLVSGFNIDLKRYDIQTLLPGKWLNDEDIPVQLNSYDCGVFTCMFAECCSREGGFDFAQTDMPTIRRRIVYEILQMKLTLE